MIHGKPLMQIGGLYGVFGGQLVIILGYWGLMITLVHWLPKGSLEVIQTIWVIMTMGINSNTRPQRTVISH